jgi:hypothetical protein
VAIVTPNPKAAKHGQEVPKLNNPLANTMVSWEAIMETMDQACHSSNPPKNLNFDRVHSKFKVGVYKEKSNFKWNMSSSAQSKPTREMGTITKQSKTNKTIKKKAKWRSTSRRICAQEKQDNR